MITLASLVAAGIGPTQARLFEAPLATSCARFDIATPLRQAAFVAQCAHESSLFTALEEGLFYRTPERICAIFRSTVPTLDVARALAGNPKALANHVYAKRNGNGDEASGDGWRFRGRGLVQLTGRANYLLAAAGSGRPYADQPDLLLEPLDACLAAAWFWQAHRLNELADASRFDDITRAINGPAMAGAEARRHLFDAALLAFREAAPPPRSRAKSMAPSMEKPPPAVKKAATAKAKTTVGAKRAAVARRKPVAKRKSRAAATSKA